MDEQPNGTPIEDEREEADAVAEIAEREPPRTTETPAVDAAEEIAEREAEEYEDQDTLSGDDPPSI